MPRYQIITLVDITRTNPARSETDHVKLSQQANFNSLIQAIGMRSNVTWDRDPKRHTGRLPEPAQGKATHWIWEFDCERDQVFLKDKDPVGLLKSDLDGVPIVAGLGDSIELAPACFFSQGDRINTWIREIS